MPLSPDQQKGSDKFMDYLLDDTKSEISISGPGGTGKSFLTKYLINAASKQIKFLDFLTGDNPFELSIPLTATTNKAASVLGDLADSPATTIHSLLGLKVQNDFRTGKVLLKKTRNSIPIFNSIIFIDEASMVNTQLLKIIREQTVKCKLVFIGDSYQLAPVGENTCPVFEEVQSKIKLSTIQRQVADSPIIQLASKYREALDKDIFPMPESNGKAIQVVSGPEFKEMIDHNFLHEPTIESKTIAWTNDRVHQYNDYIRSLHTSNLAYNVEESIVTNKPILNPDGTFAAATEKVLIITNITEGNQHGIDGYNITLDYEINTFQPKNQYDVKNLLNRLANNKDWQEYFKIKEFFADLRPIHACTVHKSQGSSYDTVFIDVADIGRNRSHSEVARMMYVATSRARTSVVMTGELPSHFYK